MNSLTPTQIAAPQTTTSDFVDEAVIETLVRDFYERVRADQELGPIFAEAIPGDWEPHLQNMMAFWSSVMLKSGRFKGRPMQKHQALTAVSPQHFQRWLAIFRDSALAVCPPELGAQFIGRAERIAESLMRGMFDTPPAPCAA